MTAILAVDDDPDILTALRRALTPLGVTLLLTEDPTEVLTILDEQPVALLISDIDMPQMTGLELMAKVRLAHPEVVRMLLTGRATFDSAMTAINQGEVHRYLNKPFEPAELRKLVQEGLARSADLARGSRAGINAEKKRQLFEQLEAEHPGLTKFVRDPEGTYLVSASRASKAERLLAPRSM
ncbi:MAG TPA: response regulator [Candidatus Acidoferrum sp.]|nr:response regulator [Candidatus Acidoferrum sp.]